MTMRDYDAFADEEKPIIVPVLGKKWKVQRSPRADHMAMLQRALAQAARVSAKIQAGKADDIDLDTIDDSMTDTVSVAEVLAGKEVVDEWLAGGIRESQLKAIVQDLWAEQEPERAAGKRKAGKRPPASSSRTGRSSKPTSPASTG